MHTRLNPHTRASLFACKLLLVAVFGSSVCWGEAADSANNKIDGVWSGTYGSNSSPPGTKEILMFGTVAPNQVVGAYLSQSGSAGVASGVTPSGPTYTLTVLQPVEGCPKPAEGTLTVNIDSGDKISYSFKAIDCKGNENIGNGTAVRYDISKPQPSGPPPAQTLMGFWNGVYTSTDSPKPVQEILAFAAKANAVTGVYLSKDGATGILTGNVTDNRFTLKDDAPSTTCSSLGAYTGTLQSLVVLDYGFNGKDCHGNSDIGKGNGKKAAALPW